jgi:uncharacterized protein (TIGR03437 family)
MKFNLLLLSICVVVPSIKGQTSTATVLSVTGTTHVFGQPVILTATVTPAAATGRVIFLDGTAILGAASLKGGVATISSIEIGYGKRLLRARFAGNSHYAGSDSVYVPLTVSTKPGGSFVPTGAGPNGIAGTAQAAADLNHDGIPDLVVSGTFSQAEVTPYSINIYLGKGDGTFEAPHSYLNNVQPLSVVVVDINTDGIPDLAVTLTDHIAILIGKGDGTFVSAPDALSSGFSLVRAADVNADGFPDLLLLDGSGPDVEILFGNGDGTFQTDSPVVLPIASLGGDLLVADFNGDGLPDMAVACPDANSIAVFLGLPGGAFGPPASYPSYYALSLATSDVNNDGKLDLIVGNFRYSSFDVFEGNGDGTFSPAKTIPAYIGPPPVHPGSGPETTSINSYDFDGDGNADLVFSAGTEAVMLGNGDGTFAAPFYLSYNSDSLIVADFNRDGIPDAANTSGDSVEILLGRTSPHFSMIATPNPVMLGDSTTITAISSYPDATGSLTFSNFGPLTTVPLANGQASFTSSTLPLGGNYILATYSGDSKYAPTTLTGVYLPVQEAIKLSLSASPNPSIAGAGPVLTATLSKPVPNGVIEFLDGATPIGRQVLNSTQAKLLPILSAGTHQLTAYFPGYEGFLPASSTVVEVVNSTAGAQPLGGPSYFTGTGPTQIVAADFNGDNLIDLAILNAGNQTVSVLLNSGEPEFLAPVNIPLAFVPGAMILSEFNTYGLPALVITDPADNAVAVLPYSGSNQFTGGAVTATTTVGKQPVALASADFDGDGLADLVVANAGSNDVSFLFSEFPIRAVNLPCGNHPSAVVVADFNGDGKADFAVANRDDNTVAVFTGNGDGTFHKPVLVPTGSRPIALVTGDLNGDGKTDFAVIDQGSGDIRMWLGGGDGTFRSGQTLTVASPSAAILADLNGDGVLDLAVTSASGVYIFSGKGDGSFGQPDALPQYAGGSGIVATTLAGDGRMELLVALPASNSVASVVNGQPTTATLELSAPQITMGDKVTLTVNVSPSGSAGLVSFFDGFAQVGAAKLINGRGSYQTAMLRAGAHSITAHYMGGFGYGSSSTSASPLVVKPVISAGLSLPLSSAFNPSDGSPTALVGADFDNDGIEDLASWFGYIGLGIAIGKGDGTFAPDIIQSPNSSVTGMFPLSADFNNDGNTDLAAIQNNVGVYLGTGRDSFYGVPGAIGPSSSPSLAVADFDGDGIVDLAVLDPAGFVDVMRGYGDGSFQSPRVYAVGENPFQVAAADMNRDGKADLVVIQGNGAVAFLAGHGDGTFAALVSAPLPYQAIGLAIADFNGDGLPDLAISGGYPAKLSILIGRGDGSFEPPFTTTLPYTIGQIYAFDMNGDGHQDLVALLDDPGAAFGVLYGTGSGTAQGPVYYPDSFIPSGIAIGDFNGDGMLDVAIAGGPGIDVFLGAATSLSAAQGSNQKTQVGKAFQVTLGVKALAGSKVTFTAPPSGGLGDGASATFPGGAASVTVAANSSGIALAPTLTANEITGAFVVTAGATGLGGIVNFDLTNLAGPPASFAVEYGDRQKAPVNQMYRNGLLVEVLDSFGNGVQGMMVRFAAPFSGASGTFSNGLPSITISTNAYGDAEAYPFTANGITGAFQVIAAATGFSTNAIFSLTNTSGPIITAVSGASQSATLNSAFPEPFRVKVIDGYGNLAQNQSVQFTAPATGPSAAFAPTGSRIGFGYTDNSGTAPVGAFTAVGAAGSFSIVVTLVGPSSGAGTPFPFSVTPDPVGKPLPQYISFPEIPMHAFGDPPFALGATASSGLPVTYTVTDGPATVSGGMLTITGPGAIYLNADQAGNVSYQPAPTVSQVLYINPPPTVISAVENAASYAKGTITPGSYAVIFGTSLALETAQDPSASQVSLGGVSVSIKDQTGVTIYPKLSYVSPGQVDLIVPQGFASGPATLTMEGQTPVSAQITIAAVEPGLFTANSSGSGPAAANQLIVERDDQVHVRPVANCSGSPEVCVAVPLDLSTPETKSYLSLFGTGIRGNLDLSKVSATIGGIPAPVTYAGPQGGYPALDQVNIYLDPSFAGKGLQTVVVTVLGKKANPVQVAFK